MTNSSARQSCIALVCKNLYYTLNQTLRLLLTTSLVCILPATILQGQPYPPTDFVEETVVGSLSEPTAIEFLPNGKMLIAQKGGVILITDNAQPETPLASTSTYLTIPDVNTGSERGVTNLIIDPNFSSNNYIYVYYTNDDVDRARVSRFTHNPATNTADPASEFVIWQDNVGFTSCCHYGGAMGFIDDNTILLATGDKFLASRAQDLTDASGKIHRFKSDGTIPPSNPFYNTAGAIQSIYATGVRNPFTGWVDRSGPVAKFYIHEVGGNNHSEAFEDIHVITAADSTGANLGWPACGDGAGGSQGGTDPNGRDTDGSCTDPAFLDPIFSYSHTSNGSKGAVMGGFMYTGTQFPATYQGVYFFR